MTTTVVLLDAASSDTRSTVEQQALTTGGSSAVSLYKQPDGWMMSILKEFFSDIDWQAIEKAREQVEKFIRKVERLMRSLRSSPSKQATDDESGGRIFSRLWMSSGSASAIPSPSLNDATNVKQMLERVACFVGYMRILTNSQEALAELDASRVVSNLFAGPKANSSGYFSNWFG